MTVISMLANYKAKTKELMADLKVDNVNALPKIDKVTINVGLGQNRTNKDMIKFIEESLVQITAQKPVSTIARKSIAGFKLRAGEHVGYKTTLRGNRMNDFLDRLINVTIPRIREFKGFDVGHIDARGNITIGFKDTIAFAELGHKALEKPFGMSVVISIKQSSKEKSEKLLKTLGFPLKIK